jgi:hypothetical protein
LLIDLTYYLPLLASGCGVQVTSKIRPCNQEKERDPCTGQRIGLVALEDRALYKTLRIKFRSNIAKDMCG